jgi:putative transposase
LTEFSEALVLGLKADLGVDVHAWVVLPNHYHLLVQIDLEVFRPRIARIHNGKSTQWNREDGTPGRKVWYRFSDRSIRSQRHYYASLNHIHANPVKHAHVARADEWPWSSLPRYLEKLGRERLVEWWIRYPVRDYGKGWDD